MTTHLYITISWYSWGVAVFDFNGSLEEVSTATTEWVMDNLPIQLFNAHYLPLTLGMKQLGIWI